MIIPIILIYITNINQPHIQEFVKYFYSSIWLWMIKSTLMMLNQNFSGKGHYSFTEKVGSFVTVQVVRITKPSNNILKNKSCCSGYRTILNNLCFSPASQVVSCGHFVYGLGMLRYRIYRTDEINSPFFKIL
jgi:hypothetical protein